MELGFFSCILYKQSDVQTPPDKTPGQTDAEQEPHKVSGFNIFLPD